MSSSKIRPFIIQLLVAAVVIVVGVYIGMQYVSNKETPQKRGRMDLGILVDVTEVKVESHEINLDTTGEVEASKTMSLKSEASGRVIWVNENFYPGSHMKAGDIIAKIATDDYQIKLNQAKITLKQREAALVLEEAKGRAAESELKAMQKTVMSNKELTAEETALIRRVPQLQEAMANVELAKNSLRQAQLDYERSIVKLPYEAVIQETNISLGDYVSGATTLGTMVGSDSFWVRVSLQPSLLAWTGASPESLEQVNATVKYDIGGQTVERKARVMSMLSKVESLGRMVQFVLAVDDPFGEPVNSPLLIGSFVRATLHAPTRINAIKIPRAWVREGNQVYVCSSENKLDIRQITTPYKTEEDVYVTEGLADGDRVVTTLISSPVSGRKLRVNGETKEVGQVSDQTGFMGFGPGGPGGPR